MINPPIFADLDGKLLASLRARMAKSCPILPSLTLHRSIRIALLHDDAQIADRRWRDYRLDDDGIRGVRGRCTMLKSIARSLRTVGRLDIAKTRRQRLECFLES